MLFMGGSVSIPKASFHEIQGISKSHSSINNSILISTLPSSMQCCLIPTTVSVENEEEIINASISKKSDVAIYIYGLNCNDDSVYAKYKQLVALGCSKLFIYCGGMFEWMLLQDVYGENEFPTTGSEIDILKFAPSNKAKVLMILDKCP